MPTFLPMMPVIMGLFREWRLEDLQPQTSNLYLCSFPNALISTSTPAGRSSFMSASTVWGVGSRMSISRLCVRISNCSRDFLSMVGPRSTVNLLMVVGRGIGPATRAPVRTAVSTISPALWSSSLKSYAFIRIRIFCELRSAMAVFLPQSPSLLDDLGDDAFADRAAPLADREA